MGKIISKILFFLSDLKELLKNTLSFRQYNKFGKFLVNISLDLKINFYLINLRASK